LPGGEQLLLAAQAGNRPSVAFRSPWSDGLWRRGSTRRSSPAPSSWAVQPVTRCSREIAQRSPDSAVRSPPSNVWCGAAKQRAARSSNTRSAVPAAATDPFAEVSRAACSKVGATSPAVRASPQRAPSVTEQGGGPPSIFRISRRTATPSLAECGQALTGLRPEADHPSISSNSGHRQGSGSPPSSSRAASNHHCLAVAGPTPERLGAD